MTVDLPDQNPAVLMPHPAGNRHKIDARHHAHGEPEPGWWLLPAAPAEAASGRWARPRTSIGCNSDHSGPINHELGACAHHAPSGIVHFVDDECEQPNCLAEQLAGYFGIARPDSSTRASSDVWHIRKSLILLVARVAELADALDSGSSP